MKYKFFGMIFFVGYLLSFSLSAFAQRSILIWSDDFTGAANIAPDPAKWGYDIGVGSDGWGNQELEYYTSRTQNAFLDGAGHLVIKASKETYTGNDGITRGYTSARLLTKGKFETTYGKIEARMKIPYGQGIWPAFWMLGADIDQPQVGWPKCGEIDIMENIGREPFTVHGTLHGPGYSGGNGLSSSYSLPNNQRFSDDFHLYAVEWDVRVMQFYVDGILYKTISTVDLPAGSSWVFHHPFFLILNVAVGGGWPGNPDLSTIFPQVMMVDYVRVYANDKKPTNRR